MTSPVRVVKVGGSLLRHQAEVQAKDISAILMKWLTQQPPAINVLIAGGGEFADIIRRADATYNLGEEVAHWLCVDALSITARLLGAIMQFPVITKTEELPHDRPCVFDSAPFLRSSEPFLTSTPLPHTWAVTSDSISARIAQHLAASELVLLKSCLPLEAKGYVDDYFLVAAAKLPYIRCVNLRSRDFEEIIWDSLP
jgi:aspartokinase-like uncharacterized kinase